MDILIAPKECNKLQQVRLPRPKNGEPQHFLYDEENLNLYELIQYSDKFRSWFIDNSFCQDGHFNMLTKIDPLYIFTPQLMKFAKEQFRPLHDICQEYSSSQEAQNSADSLSRLDYALSPYINWESICDTKDLDGELFVRFNETKTINWLVKKHQKVMESLKDELSSQASKATLISYALDILDDYVPDSLSGKFKDAVRGSQVVGIDLNDDTKTHKASLPQRQTKSSMKRTTSEPQKSDTKGTPKNSIANFFKKKT